jgi:hypothetical protein
LEQIDLGDVERQAAEMAQLEADIMDVNIIFKDLNEMVMDQGTTLGNSILAILKQRSKILN